MPITNSNLDEKIIIGNEDIVTILNQDELSSLEMGYHPALNPAMQQSNERDKDLKLSIRCEERLNKGLVEKMIDRYVFFSPFSC